MLSQLKDEIIATIAPRNHVVAIDLELNQPSGLIIQVGAVVGDITNGQVIARFSEMVWLHEPLNPAITKLTGIKQSQLDSASMLCNVYGRLVSFVDGFAKTRHLNPITWGGGDSDYLVGQARAYTSEEDLVLFKNPFGRRWLDAKTLYQTWRMVQNKPLGGGLKRGLINLGLKFKGRPHDACDDAENTFYAFYALLNKMRP